MGVDNFMKYVVSQSNGGWRRFHSKQSKRQYYMLNNKTLPRKLKWIYGNEYQKKRHLEKLFWRFVGGKEPNKYPYMDSSDFGVQTENDYLSNTAISRKAKRRFHRIVNHLSKRWKINYSKRSRFYLKEVNPSMNIIPPVYKSEQRNRYAYTLSIGKVFEKIHRYHGRYNLKIFAPKPNWNKLVKFGWHKVRFERDNIMFGDRLPVRYDMTFTLPWIYIKDVRNRGERFLGVIPKDSHFFHTTNKKIKARLASKWWVMYDRKFHKLYKRTKSKKGINSSWWDEGERIGKHKKGHATDTSSYLSSYFEKNYVNLYGRILFGPSRKKIRLSMAGSGLYVWDVRYLLSSTLYYWHILFYHHYLPIWLKNFPNSLYDLLSYIFMIS